MWPSTRMLDETRVVLSTAGVAEWLEITTIWGEKAHHNVCKVWSCPEDPHRRWWGLRSQYDSQLLKQEAPAGLDTQWIPLKWQISNRPSETISDPSCTLCEDESSDRTVLVLLFLIIQIKRPGDQNNRLRLLRGPWQICPVTETDYLLLWLSDTTGGSMWSVCLCLSFSFFLFVLHQLNTCVFIPM